MIKLKEIFCNHTFYFGIYKDYISVADKINKLESAIIELKCTKCNKEIKVIDRQRRYIDWLKEDIVQN